jgi:hypothetical protein
MNEIEIFGSFSGLLLNRNKTEGVGIGKLKNCKYKIAGINCTDKPIKSILMVYVRLPVYLPKMLLEL